MEEGTAGAGAGAAAFGSTTPPRAVSASRPAVKPPPPRAPPSPEARPAASPASPPVAMGSPGAKRPVSVGRAPLTIPAKAPAPAAPASPQRKPPPPPPGLVAGGQGSPTIQTTMGSDGSQVSKNPFFAHRTVGLEKKVFVARGPQPKDPLDVIVADSMHDSSPLLPGAPKSTADLLGASAGMSSSARAKLLGPRSGGGKGAPAVPPPVSPPSAPSPRAGARSAPSPTAGSLVTSNPLAQARMSSRPQPK